MMQRHLSSEPSQGCLISLSFGRCLNRKSFAGYEFIRAEVHLDDLSLDVLQVK